MVTIKRKVISTCFVLVLFFTGVHAYDLIILYRHTGAISYKDFLPLIPLVIPAGIFFNALFLQKKQ